MIFFAFEAYAEGNKKLPKKLECAFFLSVQKVENPILLYVLTQQNKYLQGLENLHYTPGQKLCNVGDVRSGTDYKNFIVDFKSNTVS